MKGMILAAGLGTRLQPFTLHHPKALYPYKGEPLLSYAIKHLVSAGIQDIIINIHHFPDQIVEYININKNFNCNILLSDERGQLLETGGGVKNAAWFLNQGENFVVRNVDIISDLDLSDLIHYHIKMGALATLAVRNRITSRYFLFDETMRLVGWENLKTTEKKWCGGNEPVCPERLRRFAFSGIQVLSPRIFNLILEEGKFSLTDLYLRLASHHPIMGFPESGNLWMDIGSSPSGRT